MFYLLMKYFTALYKWNTMNSARNFVTAKLNSVNKFKISPLFKLNVHIYFVRSIFYNL